MRRLRLSRGLSISALAEQAGLTRQGLTLIEAGRRRPRITTVASIATALGVEVGDILRLDAEESVAS